MSKSYFDRKEYKEIQKIQRNHQRPNCSEILEGLKDFQKETVDYVFQRLYTDEDCTRRFLVADEVGLGKTLVARGVIAKAIDLLWKKGVPRIDIIYICSNSNIARQNISKLVLGDCDMPRSCRISLLPTVIEDLKRRKVNYISLTPGTSFDISSGTGLGNERALLYWMLKDEWNLKGDESKKVFCGSMTLDNFKKLIFDYPAKNKIDPYLKDCFLSIVRDKTGQSVGNSNISLQNKVLGLSEAFSEIGLSSSRKKEIQKESNRCISELR